ncbi:T9SS type A sorting domain-containing protein [Flavobacterium sp. LB1P71]|uniref:T9SS type A sorting domain-containing protein n=1 Tax=Flavobacterium sp. LB1P71 TaxID=3401716 RepID=UPI003AB02B6B
MIINSQILNRSFLFILGVLFQTYSTAQVFVGADTNIFVNNEVVYVKQGLELSAASSNFYLRNHSQFLQGTSGLGTNKGVGALSVFQEGTVNEFQFNYWCSPVGDISTSTSVNNPFGITQLGIPMTTDVTLPATILAMNNYIGTASPFAIAPYWISKLINNSTYSNWINVGFASTIIAGEGFTMKGCSGINTTTVNGVQNNFDGKSQRYDFRGKPNDGTITIQVLPNEWTLTGNPYPSSIDLQAFLNAEKNCTGTAYFWEQDKTIDSHNIADYKGGYATYSGMNIYLPAVFYSYDGSGAEVTTITSPGNMYQRKYSPIGQGFMIAGDPDATGDVQMKNSYRVFVKEGWNSLSQFEKKANTKSANANTTPQIRFNTLLNNGPISQMVLAFDALSTDGVDHAMDSASPNDGPANIYFVLNNDEYVINVLPFDLTKKIAIGFKNAAEANYKITMKEILNLPEVTTIYIHDKVANIYYDIKNNFFDLTLPAGTHNTQYEITFTNGVLGLPDLASQNFLIQQNNITKNLTVSNPFQKELDFYGLYDVAGKLIFSTKHLGTDSAYVFSTSNLSDGIYIVKLTTIDKTEIGTKIIVKN